MPTIKLMHWNSRIVNCKKLKQNTFRAFSMVFEVVSLRKSVVNLKRSICEMGSQSPPPNHNSQSFGDTCT